MAQLFIWGNEEELITLGILLEQETHEIYISVRISPAVGVVKRKWFLSSGRNSRYMLIWVQYCQSMQIYKHVEQQARCLDLDNISQQSIFNIETVDWWISSGNKQLEVGVLSLHNFAVQTHPSTIGAPAKISSLMKFLESSSIITVLLLPPPTLWPEKKIWIVN